MKKLVLSVAVVLVGCALGCERGGKVEVNAPGVKVNVDSQRGVDIQAPGVDIKASREDGTRVNIESDK